MVAIPIPIILGLFFMFDILVNIIVLIRLKYILISYYFLSIQFGQQNHLYAILIIFLPYFLVKKKPFKHVLLLVLLFYTYHLI